jgi:hypothetical protein
VREAQEEEGGTGRILIISSQIIFDNWLRSDFMPEKSEPVTLKVGELTNREEFGRGIVRVDTKTMSKIGIKEGDVIEMHGKDVTGALAVRAYPADIGLNIIRMDGMVLGKPSRSPDPSPGRPRGSFLLLPRRG